MKYISIFVIILNLFIIPNLFAESGVVKKKFIVGVHSHSEFPLYNLSPKYGFSGIFKDFLESFRLYYSFRNYTIYDIFLKLTP